MKLEKNHLIIGFVVIMLAIGAYYMSQPLAVFVSPATQSVSAGGEATYEIMHYNQYDRTWDFHTKAYIGNTVVGSSSYSRDLSPGSYDDATLVITAPSTPGTYTIEFYSYYSDGPEGGWDEEYFGTLIVTAATTPTPTPVVTPTSTPDPCVGISCDDYCDETTLYYNGDCFGGQCDYDKLYNAIDCGYIVPTADPTVTYTEIPTATPTASPTATDTPDDPDEPDGLTGILIWGGGIILVLLLLLIALKAKR